MDRAVEVTAGGFDRYVAARGGELWAAAWLLTGDAQHAEDLVQTALSKTYWRYDTFVNDRHFEAYVRTTMYRTFVSWWRRLQWRSEVPSDSPPDTPSPLEDPAPGADLRRALATLPRLQRTVLVLRYFEDRPTREVAELLDIPEGTVTSHVSRGLAALRRSPHLATPEDQS
ncbi:MULTISPECIES: SigE family RNA polymerase sigma factor [Tessaracoccus]|uniref:SigE family RNA polymerase sigma factor n=1 Tax=Tessaracoccus TaxID=72763 RepID=UPI00099D447E|nr:MULTISPECIES: SigE family RNA polymerase sigma factor [Tessaracoccus]VEP40009.1 RNA polymerase sigma-E factor [Tessaracoccus lapidicaptus]